MTVTDAGADDVDLVGAGRQRVAVPVQLIVGEAPDSSRTSVGSVTCALSSMRDVFMRQA